MTIHSFIDLTNTLLDEEGVSFLLSEKFSQDPLEEHFGRQRRAGGNNENPTYKQFLKQEISLNNMGYDFIQTIRHGNASGKDKERVKIDVNETRALPQAPKSKK
uniref:Transposable element P transposase-like RNase H C-terminal domain-containing protein n=1 Tax=Clytia hemisphaerica TaxID=252671 RepID=A0A7M5XIK1_9CNID